MEERLQKFLARAGLASRRAAEELIAAGRVTVNGAVVKKMGVKVDPAQDEVRLDTVIVRAPAAPEPVPDVRPDAAPGAAPPRPPAGALYLLLFKPAGFLTTTSDDRGRPTVMDLMPPLRGRVFPVGRLDIDSEGLLLLTSDGSLAQLLTHPRYEVPKTYDLRVRGEVTPEHVREVERGVWLSEGRTGPARMWIRKSGRDISHVEMTLREGKNREVRRIFARLRHPVLSLRRTRLGPLELGDLKPGQVRRLGAGEVRALYAAALGMGAAARPPEAARPARPPKGRSKGWKPGSRTGGASRPSKGGGRPFKGGDRPFKGGDRSHKGGDRPFKGGDRPHKGGGRPFKGGDRPFKGGDRPFKGGDRPFKGGDRPFKGGDRPFKGGDRPFKGGDRPFKGGDRPFKGGDRPFKGGTRPFKSGDRPDRPHRPSRPSNPRNGPRPPRRGGRR